MEDNDNKILENIKNMFPELRDKKDYGGVKNKGELGKLTQEQIANLKEKIFDSDYDYIFKIRGENEYIIGYIKDISDYPIVKIYGTKYIDGVKVGSVLGDLYSFNVNQISYRINRVD